jgi:hypothetical protein
MYLNNKRAKKVFIGGMSNVQRLDYYNKTADRIARAYPDTYHERADFRAIIDARAKYVYDLNTTNRRTA